VNQGKKGDVKPVDTKWRTSSQSTEDVTARDGQKKMTWRTGGEAVYSRKKRATGLIDRVSTY